MATKLQSYTMDEDTLFRLEYLDQKMNVKPNRSRVLRDLIEKEYVFRKGLENAPA